MKKVMIIVKGGLVKSVVTDEKMDVTIVDLDVDGTPDEELTDTIDGMANVYKDSEVDPDFIEKFVKE